MIFRDLGNTGIKVPVFGLGGLRLDHIKEETALAILDESVKNGVNWVETSSSYGASEKIIGKFNKDNPDNKLNVINKVAPWEVSKGNDFYKFFDAQRKKLNVDNFQLYLAYCIKSLEDYYDNFKNNGLIDALFKTKEEGLIKHIGCSIHASPDEIITILDDAKFEVVEIYYNAITYHEYKNVIAYCMKNNIGIMSMGPLHGGVLSYESERIPDTMENNFKSKVQRILAWQFSQGNISISFVGCEKLTHLYEALEVIHKIEDGSENSDRTLLISEKSENVKVCTSCRYCEPCPHGVSISANLKFHRLRTLLGKEIETWARNERLKIIKKGMSAEDCIGCGECLDKCPQKLNIPELLKAVTEYGRG